MYAEVIIEYPVKTLDKSFTYKVPNNFENIIKVGMKVLVPFGSKNVNGIVVEILYEKPDYETKEIISLENPDIFLNEEQMEIGSFLKEDTLCTYISAYGAMLPSALKIKKQKHKYDLYDTYVLLNENANIDEFINNNKRSFKKLEIIESLKEGKCLKKAFSKSAINDLIKKEIVKEEKVKKHRINVLNSEKALINLNSEQEDVYKSVDLNGFNTYLLHGVTGSGKTEVYMRLIKDVIKNGKSAIVLVPEISLTAQTVKRFYDYFGSDVAVFHSGLSNGEKYDEYLKIYNDEVKIVVGTRSSIFVPLKNLGIIVIDEEHSDTYKQEVMPRYDAIKVAKFRCEKNGIPLLLASASPSLESCARAKKGVYKYLTLKKRANENALPEVVLVDMTKENYKSNHILSEFLKESIQNTLDRGEQIILLLNRRGHSTFINCQNCGYTYKCPNCDITLTYHKSTNNLRCHYCGYCQKCDEVCPKCNEKSLNYLGLGTQRLEEELNKCFSEARIVRMDQDTTSKKGSFDKIIEDFANNKYDIMLGTQMISKGLDFKNVTLVGIINADTSLNIPDFRANENTFDLLYQTSGRSGRSKKEGKVIIQTYNPDNEVLNYVKNNDYDGFYNYEMNIRHVLKYPPYTYIALIEIKSSSYELASKNANEIKKILEKNISKDSIILGPSPASVFKINNIYNFNIIVKYTFDDKLLLTLKNILDSYILNKNVTIDITFDPKHF